MSNSKFSSGSDQNAFIERFNRSYREEVSDAYLFDSLEQVREITESLLREYNEERPHESLGSGAVPELYAKAINEPRVYFCAVCFTGKSSTRPRAS